MTRSSQTRPEPLRGDVCPPWCGAEHLIDRTLDSKPLPPDDQGVMHLRSVDAWQPMHEDGADTAPIDVWIEEKRYDNDPSGDWLQIFAENVHPGSSSELVLHPADARRLGEALIKACNIVEGKTTAPGSPQGRG